MKPAGQQRGSLLLLVMCLVAVVGIALASYLAFSTKTMQLSNRAYAKDVSQKLAEMGLERTMRSYSFNTFSSWTLSGITASEALTTTSSPALPTFGSSGIIPSVNTKVYHYRTTNKATIWNYYTNYSSGDFVWHQGVWYLCIAAATGQSPATTAYWTAAPEPWSSTANYQVGNIAIYNDSAYRCTAANTNTVPTNTSYWTSQTAANWSSATTYAVDDVVLLGGVPYRCISGHTNQSPPSATYWLCPPVIYSEGVATLNDSAGTTVTTQLRAFIAPAPLFPNALGATTLVTLPSTSTVDSYNQPLTANWSSSTAYVPGDVVRSGSTLYRCIAGHTNQAVSNASYWTTAPLGYSAVIAGGNTSGTAVSVANAVIGGYVAAPSSSTSPFAHQASFGSGSSLPSLTNPDGTVTAPHATATKVDLTRISRSPYIPQFDIQNITSGGNLPAAAGSGTRLNNGAHTLGSPTATTPAVYNITQTNYTGSSVIAGLYLDDTTDILTIDGPVILNVTGQLQVYQGKIVITTNGSLELRFTGALYIGALGGGIQNQTYDPKRCILIGTNTSNTSSSHYFWTDVPYYGVLYMPYAYVNLYSYTGSMEVYGAVSAANITSTNNGVKVHYDTSLRTAGSLASCVDGPYIVSQIRELTSPSEKITLP